jgi:hypothetical protein
MILRSFTHPNFLVALNVFIFASVSVFVDTAMGDVGAISYFYVLENTFFSLLLLFAWVYFDNEVFFPLIRKAWPVELLFVFCMYLPPIRTQWPVSSFRDSLATSKGQTEANRRFFVASTYVVKYFYV